MSDELKPCPFCGGEAELNQARDTRIHWRVHCTTMSCPANCINVWEMKEEIAIQKWNTRKPVEKIKEEIEKLEPFHVQNYGDDMINLQDVIDIVKAGGMNGK